MRYAVTLIIAAAVILLVYLLCENCILLVFRHEKLGNRLRIAHISDIHKKRIGVGNRLIPFRVAAERPDLILLTGDIVSRREDDFSVTERLLKDLCVIAPVYMVYGNHEQSLITPDRARDFEKMLARTDVVLLRNSTVQTEINGVKLNICGLELPYTTYKKDGGYFHLDRITADDITSILGEKPEGETLLLAHNPLFGKEYAEWGADYTFSGHVHGGSVRLFGIGMLSPERKLFPRYAKGVYNINEKKLLVSAGIGKLRAFNPPEVVIYEL